MDGPRKRSRDGFLANCGGEGGVFNVGISSVPREEKRRSICGVAVGRSE